MKLKPLQLLFGCLVATLFSARTSAQTAFYYSARVGASKLLGKYDIIYPGFAIADQSLPLGVCGELQLGARLHQNLLLFGGVNYSSNPYRYNISTTKLDTGVVYYDPGPLSQAQGSERQTYLYAGVRQEFRLIRIMKIYLETELGSVFTNDSNSSSSGVDGTKWSVMSGVVLKDKINLGFRYSYTHYPPIASDGSSPYQQIQLLLGVDF